MLGLFILQDIKKKIEIEIHFWDVTKIMRSDINININYSITHLFKYMKDNSFKVNVILHKQSR